jgi:hypothetical protein
MRRASRSGSALEASATFDYVSSEFNEWTVLQQSARFQARECLRHVDAELD